jgi:hypothetical protein
MLSDIEILIQLIHNHHLEPKEIERAKQLIHSFKLRLENE